MRRLLLSLLALLPLAATAACDNTTNPFDKVVLQTDSTLVLRTPTAALDGPSALDATVPLEVYPELPQYAGQWDFTLRNVGGSLSLVTLRTATTTSRPRIARSNQSYDAIDRASRRASDYPDTLVSLAEGQAFTFRTRLYNRSGQQCFTYGKMRVISLDVAAGTVRLGATINANRCDDERLKEN